MNERAKLKSILSIQTALWAAMALALLGSLRHVAATFASIDGNSLWGWGQAIAVDVGLVALALGITQYRRLKRKTWLLWFGVAVFTIISVYANACYGIQHDWQLPDTVLTTAPFLAQVPDWLLAIKVLVLAAPLPILVLYLAEIIGGDVSHAIKEAERADERDKNRQIRELRQQMADMQAQLSSKELTLTDKLRQWLDEHEGGAGWTQQQIADEVGCARSLVGQVMGDRKGLRIAK
jgi:hypothetical protein